MDDEVEEPTLSPEELDADEPNELLAAALSEANAEPIPARGPAVDVLLGQIERERGKQAARAERRGSRVVWLAAAGALAAAAAVALFFHDSKPTTPVAVAPPTTHAGTLLTTQGATVTASGSAVTNGYALQQGDAVSVTGGNAVFAQDGKVRFSIENGSTATVSHATAPLILALAIGATEADVTPVPTGDAFAVDVTAQNGTTARVAVHGTHLRVARAGDHVVVDVTEGVVAIGPQGGESTLVHAPAHAEFDATDVVHTLAIDRVAVRAADTTVHQATPLPTTVQAANHPPAHGVTLPSTTKPTSTDTVVAPVLEPEQLLAQDVKNCVVAVPTSTQVSLTVETKLSLHLADDGTVQKALFEPPLPADAQECAARAIYKKGLFAHGGDVSIPIVVRR
jgi:hypothetical protein